MEEIIINSYIQGGALGLLFVVLGGLWYLERKERQALQAHNRELYDRMFDLTVELKTTLVQTQKFLEELHEEK